MGPEGSRIDKMTQNALCANINGESRIDLAQPDTWTARSLTQTGKGNGQAGFGGENTEFSFEHVDFEMFMSHPSGDIQKMETQLCGSGGPRGQSCSFGICCGRQTKSYKLMNQNRLEFGSMRGQLNE